MEFALEGLGWKSFQDLALMYVQQQFKVAAVSFSAGPDGGRDGAAVVARKPHANVGILAMQAKHTAKNGNLVFSDVEPELPKIKELVGEGLCETYVLVTNKALSAPMEAKCRKAIEAVGVPKAVIVGREELIRRLTEDKQLRGLIPRVYGLGDLSEILDERLYAQTQALVH